ncbi:MAG: hypothetical protein ACI364_01350 [Coriobacteriales bacterium]
MVPLSFMQNVRSLMDPDGTVLERYLAIAHGGFRGVPSAHFFYGSSESLYTFAPSFAAS